MVEGQWDTPVALWRVKVFAMSRQVRAPGLEPLVRIVPLELYSGHWDRAEVFAKLEGWKILPLTACCLFGMVRALGPCRCF